VFGTVAAAGVLLIALAIIYLRKRIQRCNLKRSEARETAEVNPFYIHSSELSLPLMVLDKEKVGRQRACSSLLDLPSRIASPEPPNDH